MMKITAPITDNPGVVPPWLGHQTVDAARNPGIVPPWLAASTAMSANDGIVPPWLSRTPLTSPYAQVTTEFVR